METMALVAMGMLIFLENMRRLGTDLRNRFFTSPDGTQIWNTFNADANSAGACDSTRYTMAEVMQWSSSGAPVFSAPAKAGTVLTGPSGE
jgi:hypothetical protein